MYLLDTNAVIDFCNGKLPTNSNNLLSKIEPNISVITRIELFASNKISLKESAVLNEFVEISKVYDNFNTDIINKTIQLRQEYRIKLPDAIIAATAIVYDLILITRNVSDFKNIQEIKIIDTWKV